MAKSSISLNIAQAGQEGQFLDLPEGIYTIGSDSENKIVLNDSLISWRHAILSFTNGGLWVEDLGSSTGTYVDGARITGRHEVRGGQRIQIGSFVVQQTDSKAAHEAIVTEPESVSIAGQTVATQAVPSAPTQPSTEPPTQPPTQPPLSEQTGTPAATPGQHANSESSQGRISNLTNAPTVSDEDLNRQSVMAATSPLHNAPKTHRDEGRIAIKKQIHAELLKRLDLKRMTVNQATESDLHERARETVGQIIQDVREKLPPGLNANALAKEIIDEALGLGPIEDLLADESVTEVMVNGPDRIYVERNGSLQLTDASFIDDVSVMATIERIVTPIGRRIDESSPYVDARLPDGSRVNCIIPPLALKGPTITIRKFSKDPFTIQDLIGFGSITQEMADFSSACVQARKNIIVSGGTGTGKTTMLNVVSNFIPTTERIVTIEDAAELRLVQDHVVSLEARPPNMEGKGAIMIRDLVRNSLRMRPDRIVVGECRGGEALDMLQAMNTGHDGSITTVHANSPRDVISRLETMVLMSGMDLPVRAIREQVGSAIQVIIHLKRFSDGSRRVSNVTEVCGMEGEKITMQDLFEYVQTGVNEDGKILGEMRPTGAVPTFMEEIKARGIPLDSRLFETSAGW